mgnify:CR=1 FL=1
MINRREALKMMAAAGEFYPFKPDIFAATYDPVHDASGKGEGQ